jgi:hypothetical protein
MPRRSSVVVDGLSLVGDALDDIDSQIAAVAARMALGNGTPSPSDVRDAAEEIFRGAVESLRMALDAIGQEPTVGLTTTLLAHLSGVQRSAGLMIRAGLRNGIDPEQIRADLADSLRGNDVDTAKYGLSRADMTGLRTVKSDTVRLVADQGFDAVHRAELERIQAKGQAMADWVVSARHKIEDECDDIARKGPYHVDRWPMRPHPFCGCMPREIKTATV